MGGRSTEEFINYLAERVPEDVHPGDIEGFLRDRYSKSTIDDDTVELAAEEIADDRDVPDDPRDVELSGEEAGRGEPQVGEITFDSEANRWRDKKTGNFVSETDL